MDFSSGETFEDASPALNKGKGRAKKTFPRYSHTPRTENKTYTVRRALLEDGTVVPLCHTHSIRAELEMEVYGRELFEE
jgi:hypothetical protein